MSSVCWTDLVNLTDEGSADRMTEPPLAASAPDAPRLVGRAVTVGRFALSKLRPSPTEPKLGYSGDETQSPSPAEVRAVSRIRGTQGIQEDTKGHDELGN